MKVEITFSDINVNNRDFIEGFLKKHDLKVEKYHVSFYGKYRIEMDIKCYQFDDLIEFKTFYNLDFEVRVL